MKIEDHEAVVSFLKRCRRNLNQNALNRFLDSQVTPGKEAYVKKQLKKAGAQEFDGDAGQWPSLFLLSKEIQQPHLLPSLQKMSSRHYL